MKTLARSFALIGLTVFATATAHAALKWPASALNQFKTGPVHATLADQGSSVVLKNSDGRMVRVSRGEAPTVFVVNAKSLDLRYLKTQAALMESISAKLPLPNAAYSLLIPRAFADALNDHSDQLAQAVGNLIEASSNTESCQLVSKIGSLCKKVADDVYAIGNSSPESTDSHNEATLATVAKRNQQMICNAADKLESLNTNFRDYPGYIAYAPANGSAACGQNFEADRKACVRAATRASTVVPSAKDCAAKLAELSQKESDASSMTPPTVESHSGSGGGVQ